MADNNNKMDILDFGDGDVADSIIKVIGVGGGGGNAVNHMYREGIHDVTFVLCNTDAQALNDSPVPVHLQLGKEGLGAGNRPERARQAAEETSEDIKRMLNDGTKMAFITAGMGGGTGTGAAPVVAQIAREMGILTVAVVTKPFSYEGARRMQRAEEGLLRLKEAVDSQIVILNDKLEDELGEDASVSECFAAADDVLFKACAGITEIIQTPGLIGVDFEDLRTVMSERGTAMMGSAIASGPDRARIAAENAVACPLLEGVTLNGARGVLVYITASEESMKMKETKTVMNIITNFTAKGAQVIYGSAYDDSMGDSMRVTVVATGLDGGADHVVPPLEKKEEERPVWAQPSAKPVAAPAMPTVAPVVSPVAPVQPAPVKPAPSTNIWDMPVQQQSSPMPSGQPAPNVMQPTASAQSGEAVKPQEEAEEPAPMPFSPAEEKPSEETETREWAPTNWWSSRRDGK